MYSSRLAYYILFLVFPFQTQTDGEGKTKYTEGRDVSDHRTSSPQYFSGDEKIAGPDILVTTNPVITTGETADNGKISQRSLNIV